jgi:hypothetical protein
MRLTPPFVLALSLASCAQISQRPLTPLGLTHAREGFRGPLAGLAVVLPILECNTRQPGVQLNLDAEQATGAAFPSEIWQQLGLPGPVEEGRLDESADLCGELADNHDRGTNLTLVSPVMREQVRNYFNRFVEQKWLVVITRALKVEESRETSTALVSTYIFTPAGEVAYRADLECDTEGKDEQHNCGTRYELASKRVTEMLDGFPRGILTDPKIPSVQPPSVSPGSSAPSATAPQKSHRHHRK